MADLFMGTMMVILGVLFVVMGILYLAKIGYWYNKLIEQKSEAFARNIGIAFVVIGSLLLVAGTINYFL